MNTTTEPVTYLLYGGRGWLELLADGRGVVRDGYGRAVTTVPAHSVQHYLSQNGGGQDSD